MLFVMYIIPTKLFSVPPIVFFSSGGEGVPQYKENTEFPSSFSLPLYGTDVDMDDLSFALDSAYDHVLPLL